MNARVEQRGKRGFELLAHPLVLRRQAQLLTEVGGATRVLDVGAGPGKFCIVGALSTSASYTGVEQRLNLVQAAIAAGLRFGADRARVVHANLLDFDCSGFDGFYLYNPFREQIEIDECPIDETADRSPAQFWSYIATTIAALADPSVKPIDQNTARYFNRLAIDDSYAGMADSEQEGERLARLLGNKSRLMMGNHGVLVTANTVGEAFDDIYTLERACQVLVQAYSTGQPLKVLPDEVAENTAQDWEQITDFSIAHFEEMKRVLDAEDTSYAH